MICLCVSPQALLLHGSLPEEDQDGSVGFGESRPSTEQQLVGRIALALHPSTPTHSHSSPVGVRRVKCCDGVCARLLPSGERLLYRTRESL